MDENRVVGSFRDELGLAIEAMVRVAPAPELRALVRVRVDRERAVVRWAPWQLALGGALALSLAVATATWQRNREQSPARAEMAAAYHNTLSAYAVAAARVPSQMERSVLGAKAAELPVRTEAAMLAAYVAHIRQRRLDPAAPTDAADRPSREPLKLTNISIERIAIEPLAKLETIAGERQ